MIVFFYKNDWRKLKQLITWLLKSWAATQIRRINYAQSYTLQQDKKIEKIDEKVVIIEYVAENKWKIESLLKKSEIYTYHILPQ